MDYAKFIENLPEIIRNARRAAGLSQSQAAKAWEVELRSLQKWETKAAIPSAKNLAKLLSHIPPAK